MDKVYYTKLGALDAIVESVSRNESRIKEDVESSGIKACNVKLRIMSAGEGVLSEELPQDVAELLKYSGVVRNIRSGANCFYLDELWGKLDEEQIALFFEALLTVYPYVMLEICGDRFFVQLN